MKNEIKLDYRQIRKLQIELQDLNVVEEVIDHKISKEYLELFLKKYSELEGEYGYIQGAILTSLFDFIRKKKPNINDSELINRFQKLYPIIKGMLVQEQIFKLIKDAKKGKLSELKNENRKK